MENKVILQLKVQGKLVHDGDGDVWITPEVRYDDKNGIYRKWICIIQCFLSGKKSKITTSALTGENVKYTGVINTFYGIYNGKQSKRSKLIRIGKNLKNKNITNGFTQAIREGHQNYTKMNKKAALKKVMEVPMLAVKFEENTPDFTRGVWFIQPKLDGIRCLAYQRDPDKGVIFQTRSGETFPFSSPLSDEINHVLKHYPTLVLDGELYLHNQDFEKINSYARKGAYNNALELHIFDAYETDKKSMIFEKRVSLIKTIKSKFNFKLTHFVETQHINKPEDADKFYKIYQKMKYEGMVYKFSESVYKPGRSKDIIKRKEHQTEEAKIIGYTKGHGIDGPMVIWVCEMNGKKFEVVQKGTVKFKESLWTLFQKDPKAFDAKFKGKLLTVKFLRLTKAGIPREPVGLTIRKPGW